jgi:hypothetical protein
MRPAGQVADPADLLAADDVPARVAGVEDLVEDQLDRPSQADQPQRRGRQRDEDDERGVEARPAPDRGGVGGGDGCRPLAPDRLSILAPRHHRAAPARGRRSARLDEPLAESVEREADQ